MKSAPSASRAFHTRQPRACKLASTPSSSRNEILANKKTLIETSSRSDCFQPAAAAAVAAAASALSPRRNDAMPCSPAVLADPSFNPSLVPFLSLASGAAAAAVDSAGAASDAAAAAGSDAAAPAASATAAAAAARSSALKEILTPWLT